MLSHIAHGGTIYLQNGSTNALEMLYDVCDVYDTQLNKRDVYQLYYGNKRYT
jgi:hypothetical protein